MCLGQTWYLGNDMQFFIISPPIIFIMWKSPKVGKIVSGVLVLLSTVSAITVAWVNEFPASPLFQGMDFDYMRWYYFVPWCRFQPYICGMCLGFFLHHMRGKKLGINPVAAAWIWVVAFVIGSAVIYGLVPYQQSLMDWPAPKTPTVAEASLYNGLHRLAWSIALSWVIIACVKNLGGPINTFLSYRGWAPLARMSYCMYLVHMTIIDYYLTLPSYTVTVSHVMIIYYLLWVTAMSAAVAYVCVIAFEMPIAQLEKLLLGGFKKKTPTIQDKKE